MVAAAFIGPGTVTTATLAGAGYGYTLLWAVLFSTLATVLLQEMAARLGVAGRLGLGDAIRQKVRHPVWRILAFALVLIAILGGNAAYEAGNLTGAVLGFDQWRVQLGVWQFNPLILLIGALAFLLLFSGKYRTIERFLVLLVGTMSLVFFFSALLIQPDLGAILQGLFVPVLPENALLMVMGLIGTTIVPYNLFLHASAAAKRWESAEDLQQARRDTVISVFLGGLITMAIVITAAAALHGQVDSVNNAGDLAQQLRPLLGEWAQPFLSLGFLAAGLSSSITAPLAAAFATAGILGWSSELTGKKFRMVWMFVLLIGIAFSLVGFRPLTVILFAQIANGILLPVIAAFLLWVMNDKNILGALTNTTARNVLGLIVLLVALGLGLKSIIGALG
ncbi:manganese transporter [Flavilitoribacter nigricans DSM 23189 = NBRC 102662]|uniref:Manganese transporter n=2 Tax=Flavilitoribacter TaxID=2762562 RepID=A0A2D0NA54_FLAN2|nr:manganese transporter [Flavilitoribacter nigricans DSM 23189 = NBRC 102662]